MEVTPLAVVLGMGLLALLLAAGSFLILNSRRYGLLEAELRGKAYVHQRMTEVYSSDLAEVRWIRAAARRQITVKIAVCDAHGHAMASAEDSNWSCMTSTCCHRLTCKPAAPELSWEGAARTQVDLPCGHSHSDWHRDDPEGRWVLRCAACQNVLASQPYGQGP